MKQDSIKREALDPEHADGIVITGEYEGTPPEDVQLYWHVFTKVDTEEVGTPDAPVHLLSVVGGVEDKTPQFVVGDMTLTHTFDHEPTREELDSFVPEEFSK